MSIIYAFSLAIPAGITVKVYMCFQINIHLQARHNCLYGPCYEPLNKTKVIPHTIDLHNINNYYFAPYSLRGLQFFKILGHFGKYTILFVNAPPHLNLKSCKQDISQELSSAAPYFP